MQTIITPSKTIITPKNFVSERNVFRTLGDLKRRKEIKDSDIAFDLHLNFSTRDSRTKKLTGYERIRCHSFNANWMKILKGLMEMSDISITGAFGGGAQTALPYNNNNLYVISSALPYLPYLGPIIGTGSTTHTANDIKMEEQITHGSAAPNASVITGTAHASDSNRTRLVDNGGNSFTTDQYNQYILEITSGAISGEERIIQDTVDATYDYLTVADINSPDVDARFSAEPDGLTYKIKTYGMMTHGSVGITAPEDDGDLTSTVTITRTFSNGCGSTQSVSEFGLTCRLYTDDTDNYLYVYPLIIRDVKGTAVDIPNGQELTLTYTFSCEA